MTLRTDDELDQALAALAAAEGRRSSGELSSPATSRASAIWATSGQAGKSAAIENYLGVPKG